MILPFTLEINNIKFNKNGQDFNIPENKSIEIYFNSNDSKCKLYSEALDITNSNTIETNISENHRLYVKPYDKKWLLCNPDTFYVDSFLIEIETNDKIYQAYLNITPAQLSSKEWRIMKSDIDEEINGLSLDITKKLIGSESIILAPDLLKPYLIIKENHKKILGSFYEIKSKPHFAITVNAGLKEINYDISDNRFLKKIINFYDKTLNRFITHLKDETNSSIKDFIKKAKKLKRSTSLIKSEDWYSNIKNDINANITHSFALDPGYSNLYKLYRKLKNPDYKLYLELPFPLKRSSQLYEIWCYLKICRIFQEKCVSSIPFIDFNSEFLFTEFNEEMTMTFFFDHFRLEVIYTPTISLHSDSYPFFSSSTHITPDILINAYSNLNGKKKGEIYLGSFILDSKYRKYFSYWRNNTHCKEQIYHYKYEMHSNYLEYSPINDNPIRRVFVLTPDENIGKNYNPNIIHLTFKPNDKLVHKTIETIIADVESLYNSYLNIMNRE